MSITEQLSEVVTSANNLTKTVTDKVSSIDSRVNQFETEARNIASAATSQMFRAKIGHNQFPQVNITPGPDDDTGALVKQAFADGNKFIGVTWENDGKDRHWNTQVALPVGATLYISGPVSCVNTINGNIRSDRACYANGAQGGTSEFASPMIFRNTEPSYEQYPYNVYSKVYDQTCLFSLNGNNTVIFGNGTFVFDQGGMCPNPYGNALFRIEPYVWDMPSWVGGGGANLQFYMSGPMLNNCQAGAEVKIYFYQHHFAKLSSDGPVLTADKGFRRLLDKGVAGVTSDLLTIQPWEITQAQAAYNDVDYPGTNWGWYNYHKGIDTEADRPRFVSFITWSYGGGKTEVQLMQGAGELSMAGLTKVAGKEYFLGTSHV